MMAGAAVAVGLASEGLLEAAELTGEEKAKGWKLLFDGKSFDGWRNYKGKGVRAGWKVEDGMMVHTKGGGDIMTERQYGDFVLKLEWKVSEGGNSGIFFGVRETGGAIYESGVEMQILDNDRHADAKYAKHRAGACYGLYLPPEGAAKKAGAWNQVKVVKEGAHYRFFLNGVKTADFSLEDTDFIDRVADSKFRQWPHFARYRKGHIGLQDHGDKVSFRNIRILELNPTAPAEAANGAPPKQWDAWAKWVEKQMPTDDGQGHGPDVGSDEWAGVVDRRLDISDAQGHGPDLKSGEWRGAVEAALKRRK